MIENTYGHVRKINNHVKKVKDAVSRHQYI